MSKQHLDAFAVATGLFEGVRLGERSSHVAGVLVDVAQDLRAGMFGQHFGLNGQARQTGMGAM